jgi:hypothetical protein
VAEEAGTMNWMTEIGVPAALGLLLIGIMYVMKGVLNFVIGLPIWIIGCAVVVAGTIIFILFNIVTGFYRYGPEGFIFMQARKQGLLVINDVEIGTNNAEFILGEKTDPKNPLFKDEKSGVKVDPSMVSAYAEPLRFKGGLNIVGYAYRDILPQTTRNHLAFKAIVDYFSAGERSEDKDQKNQHPAKLLAFLTPNEKIELISKPEHFLEADLKTKVGKYFKTRTEGKNIIYFRIWPKKDEKGEQVYDKDGKEKWYEQTVDIPELITCIQQMKSDINKLPIHEGYFSMNEAFKYNNVAYTAQHLSALKNLLVQIINEDWLKKMNWLQMGTVIIGIIAVLIIGIYVLASTVFK